MKVFRNSILCLTSRIRNLVLLLKKLMFGLTNEFNWRGEGFFLNFSDCK